MRHLTVASVISSESAISVYERPTTSRSRSAIFRSTFSPSTARHTASIASSRSIGASTTSSGGTSSRATTARGRRSEARSSSSTRFFVTWKSRVLDELRASERRPRAVVALEDVPPLEVVDAPMERLEAIDAVWRAVEGLNVDLKMALLLRDVVGLSYTEIADSLEITLATVKWRIYKAREDVQLALAREGITFGDEEAPAELVGHS